MREDQDINSLGTDEYFRLCEQVGANRCWSSPPGCWMPDVVRRLSSGLLPRRLPALRFGVDGILQWRRVDSNGSIAGGTQKPRTV